MPASGPFHLVFMFFVFFLVFFSPSREWSIRLTTMSLLQFRKWHRWISIAITLPFLVTLVTGITLATRGFNTWVQPNHPPLKTGLTVSFPQLLETVKSVPEARIQSWNDVSQIDIRPGSGNIRIRAKHTMWEIQIDGSTGEITSKGLRRFSLLVAIHEGAYFGPWVRYGVFFPSALGVFFLLVSGIVLYAQPYLKKRKKGKSK